VALTKNKKIMQNKNLDHDEKKLLWLLWPSCSGSSISRSMVISLIFNYFQAIAMIGHRKNKKLWRSRPRMSQVRWSSHTSQRQQRSNKASSGVCQFSVNCDYCRVRQVIVCCLRWWCHKRALLSWPRMSRFILQGLFNVYILVYAVKVS